MGEIDDKEELEKCKNDPYYFFSNYCLINGEKPKITKEEFESKINSINGKQIRKNPENHRSSK